jgi:tRNA (pseudouridine54-N1)-methyltransferase
MDAVAGVVTATFLLSNGIRRDTELNLLLMTDPKRVIKVRLDGRRLKYLNPDERSTAALIKNSLARFWARPASEMETGPGVTVGLVDPVEELRNFASTPGAIWLTEDGKPIDSTVKDGIATVILSDPYDPPEGERKVLESLPAKKVSLGPLSLHSSHCIVLVHNILDRERKEQSIIPS